jgi:hypothetical protein
MEPLLMDWAEPPMEPVEAMPTEIGDGYVP